MAALALEGAGILNWMIDGVRDYHEQGGLCPPEGVLAASRNYRADLDLLGRFLAEGCVRGDTCQAEAGVFYRAFKLWALREGIEDAPSAQLVSRKLTELGIGREKRSGASVRLGVALTEEALALLKGVAANDS